MSWHSCSKQIEITDQTAHACTIPHVGGDPLAASAFDFTPDEFHLAAAMCSHMHPIASGAASPEAQMIRSLVAQHVDDVRPDFAIESTADSFKDFVKSYFSGTVGTGLTYLAMIRSGYNWAGHFEHLKPATTIGRTPDFVFSAHGKGTCLVESKGTRSTTRKTFDDTVENGYLKQVEGHLGKLLSNGARATHGYCVGAWMTSVSKAELLVHHSKAAAIGGIGSSTGSDIPASDERSLSLVQRQDAASMFSVVFGAGYGEAIRNGTFEEVPLLIKFDWLDRKWITPVNVHPLGRTRLEFADWALDDAWGFGRPIYAIEAGTARTLLAHFQGGFEPGEPFEGLEPLSQDFMFRARRLGDGAVLPDGLALVRGWRWSNVRLARWNAGTKTIETLRS